MYVMWFDDNPKKSVELKITEAIGAYVDRFRARPAEVLVNAGDLGQLAQVGGVPVRSEGYIRRNNFWVGARDG